MTLERKDPVSVVLFGIPFHNVTFKEAVDWAVARMKAGTPGYIATANLDFLMQAWRDPELQRILIEADLVLADGMPIVWLSPAFGPRLKERVTGSDITPMLAEAARDNDLSVFNLGGATSFNNQGTFRKSAGSGSSRFTVPFVNSGLADIQTGDLSLESCSTHSGAIDLAAGSRLLIQNNATFDA